jgi:hypothetical protein
VPSGEQSETNVQRECTLLARENPPLERRAPAASPRPMPSKPLDLPLDLANTFVKDMRAFFAGHGTIKDEEIAARRAPNLPKPAGKADQASPGEGDVFADERSGVAVDDAKSPSLASTGEANLSSQ